MEFHHISVLINETITSLITDTKGIYVDCTLGGAGHALQIVNKLDVEGRLIGIDQDMTAVKTAQARLAAEAGCSFNVIWSNFKNIEQVLDDLNIDLVDGILFDLGVSSYQLDEAQRGFSYMQDAPLDMRMNTEASFSAYDIVNSYSCDELTQIIADYGEERWAKRIAQFIVSARTQGAIATTGQLVQIIKNAIPAAARREGPHPAKRTFQAIRIEVNNELGILRDSFTAAVKRLKIGGRLCIITFHSLEDRVAKQTMQTLAKGCICHPNLPVCVCNNKPQLKIIGKPIVPSAEELASNHRSRSAKLRVARKIG